LAFLITLVFPPAVATQTVEGHSAVEEALSEIHTLVNRHRLAIGCDSLAWYEPAARVAEAHSRDMAERDYFDHVTPEGLDLARRLLAGGVAWSGSTAENLAYTPAGAPSAFDLWMDSSPHRANIERCDFTHHGVGLYRYRWTQVLVEGPAG